MPTGPVCSAALDVEGFGLQVQPVYRESLLCNVALSEHLWRHFSSRVAVFEPLKPERAVLLNLRQENRSLDCSLVNEPAYRLPELPPDV